LVGESEGESKYEHAEAGVKTVPLIYSDGGHHGRSERASLLDMAQWLRSAATAAVIIKETVLPFATTHEGMRLIVAYP